MTLSRILTMALMLSLTACSSEQLYDATQPKYTELECSNQNLPETEFRDCISRKPMSYDEYQRERGASNDEGN